MTTVRHKTPRAERRWLRARDVADELGVSAQTARRLMARMPGVQIVYAYEARRGLVRRISVEAFEAWRQENLKHLREEA